MEIWQAIVLGLTQGLTEFLPVSSSGHLVFLQRLFGIDGGLFIPIMLHLGTLVAVCVVFYKDIISLFKKPFKTLGFLILASVPAGIVGLLLDDKIEEVFYVKSYAGLLLSLMFLATAGLLLATEIFAKRRKSSLPLCFKTVIPMALAQAVAVLPGISRSGSTICAGTLAGGSREEVAKFSFLMSIPIILGSFIVSLAKGLYNGEIQQTFADGGAKFGFCVAFGFILSAAAGLFAIKLMLAAIKKADYKWFSLYLAVMSIACLVLHITGAFN